MAPLPSQPLRDSHRCKHHSGAKVPTRAMKFQLSSCRLIAREHRLF
jgi:hypothetical protein